MSDGEGPRRRKGVDETTEKLLDAAAEVFVENGYDGAVISDIARRAGVTTGAIYARWPHKSDVMAAAVEHLLERILPERRLEQFGIKQLPVIDIFSVWSARLLAGDDTPDVLVQAFASARNNEAVQQRLQCFLAEQAEQLSRLIERGKVEKPDHAGFSTVAMTLLVQSIGIGTHLVLTAGREDRQIPSEEEWTTMMDYIIKALSSPPQPPQ